MPYEKSGEHIISIDYNKDGASLKRDYLDDAKLRELHEHIPQVLTLLKTIRDHIAEEIKAIHPDAQFNMGAYLEQEYKLRNRWIGHKEQTPGMELEVLGTKTSDGIDDYTDRPVLYAKLTVGSDAFFIKMGPYTYHSGGVAEALETEHIDRQIKSSALQGIRVIPWAHAVESSTENYSLFVSQWAANKDKYPALDETINDLEIKEFNGDVEAKTKLQDLRSRMSTLRSNGSFDYDEHNAFYDEQSDEIILFDLNPPNPTLDKEHES